MLPGPDYIYQCPKCENLISNGSLLSGNTFDAKFFSDGKSIAPMLPEFPDLTKCNKCNEIFWLSDLKVIGTREWGNIINSIWDDGPKERNDPWKEVQSAEFLSIDDHYRALELGLAKDKDEKYFIRNPLWWKYNDRTREGIKIFLDSNDELRWTNNCKKLLLSIFEDDMESMMVTAEINRNLGNFGVCIHILQGITAPNIQWKANRLIGECEKGNRWVVELNP